MNSGNTVNNALPSCRMGRLVESLQACENETSSYWHAWPVPLLSKLKPKRCYHTKERYAFWIDIFGVPVNITDETVRTKAISRMTPIYLRAACVLGLDDAISRYPDLDPLQEDFWATLLRSAWMGRSWTYQEARMNPHLFFDAKAGDMARLGWSIDHVTSWTASHLLYFRRPGVGEMESISASSYDNCQKTWIYRELRNHFRFDPVGKSPAFERSQGSLRQPNGQVTIDLEQMELLEAWDNLIARSTTKSDDIILILANLVGFAINDIIQFPQNQRMKALLCALGKIPLQILFNDHPHECSNDASDRWVPQSPAGSPLGPTSYIDFAKVIPGQGLLIDTNQKTLNYLLPGCEMRGNFFTIEDKTTKQGMLVEVHGHRQLVKNLQGYLLLVISRGGQYRRCGALLSVLTIQKRLVTTEFHAAVIITPLYFKPLPSAASRSATMTLEAASGALDILIKSRESSFNLWQ